MISLAGKVQLVAREEQNRPLAVWFAGAALFTISWDRLLSFSIGPLNLKTPIILFGVAACFVVADAIRNDGVRPETPFFAIPFGLLFADLGIVAAFAADPRTAFLQTVVLAIGSVLPAVVTYSVAVRHAALDFLLTRMIQGGYLAAAFVCYQALSRTLGLPLPDKFVYRGNSGGAPRFDGFSYEPAYFGYFIIVVLAALLARAELRRQTDGLGWQIGFFITVLFLANTRAAYLTLPTFLILVFVVPKTGVVRTTIGKLLMPGIVVAVVVLLVWHQVTSRIGVQIERLFDLTEPNSNAPRWSMLKSGWDIWQQHPFGVGSGNLINYVSTRQWASYGYLAPGESQPLSFNRVIVNNMWLQALLDGGVVALLAQVIIVAIAVVACYRRSSQVAAILISGWATIILIAGMLTSAFYDLKYCAVLGLAAAAARIGSSTARPERCPDKYV